MLLSTQLIRSAFIIVLAAPLACKSEPAQKEKPASKAAPAAEKSAHVPAAVNVVPGSHEDWCDEHQVPESMCTRCNPSLVAAFKATGDWCEEHGLPESQCQQCNPALKIERPPKKEAAP